MSHPKLLLTSNGLKDPLINETFLRMTRNKPLLRVVIIPTAGDSIEWVLEKNSDRKYFSKFIAENPIERSEEYLYFTTRGDHVVVADLKEGEGIVKEKLQNTDVIYVSGGDVNYLLGWAKKVNLEAYLRDLLEEGVIYIGASAGSCLITPDIGLTWWEPDQEEDHLGLNIVDFVIVPHQNESNGQNIENLIARKKYLQSLLDFPWPVYLLQDRQAIALTEGKIEHIGDGAKRVI